MLNAKRLIILEKGFKDSVVDLNVQIVVISKINARVISKASSKIAEVSACACSN